MKNQNEYEKRYKAIQFYNEGNSFNKVLRLVQRSKGWLSKWLRRYKEQGVKGLRDQSHAPKRIWRKTSKYLIKKILSIRKKLESHKTRRYTFSGIGAEAIQWELKQNKVKNIPSLSTMSRIISHYGKAGRGKTKKHSSNQPYPYFKTDTIGDLQQTDLVGPRHLRGPKGVVRFYSFHTLDVGGHTVYTSQFTDKQTISLCKHMVSAWRFMGIPTVSQMDNEMAATGGGRYSYSISQLMRLHLLLGIHLVFIPQGEPGRNASIESFNALWQDRVLKRHNCPNLAALRRTSERFLEYYHYEKPHRSLTKKRHGTQFPGILRDRLWKTMMHLFKRFSLDKYMDPKGHLNLPISKGKISFIRKVNSDGRIEINGCTYFIRRKLEGQYVVATILTRKQRLVVKFENRTIKSFRFPIKAKVISLLSFYKRNKS